ncbi:MAG: ATP-binding protein [Spirochaetaceae bacterium]|jgi:anti-sigma regulatory factor (Ser/Thr protein kinase)|nr:ATP-binding protein [Spirochaetaceae bacterium]
MKNILYQGKRYNHLNINISANAPFNAILNQINQIYIEPIGISQEHISYAILELLNNSLRAHREKHIDKNITVKAQSKGKFVLFIIKDWGGGFDVSELPYDINEEHEKIDVESDQFQLYREKHQYRRFGMGLLSTRRVFQEFEIKFYDGTGQLGPYKKDFTSGTVIKLGVPVK